MRGTLVCAAALLLAPLPAAADVTATYSVGSERLVVEVDDNGDYRAEVPGKFALVRHGGDEFVVVTHNGKARAARSDVFFALLKGKAATDMPSRDTATIRFVTTPGKDEVIAGRKGSGWQIAPEDGDGATAVAVVVSPDAQLAPVGEVLRHGLSRAIDSIGPALGGFSGVRAQLDAVFAKGTVLRIGIPPATIALQSVHGDAIAAERFASPTGLLDAAALDAALSEPTEPPAKP